MIIAQSVSAEEKNSISLPSNNPALVNFSYCSFNDLDGIERTFEDNASNSARDTLNDSKVQRSYIITNSF